MRRYPDWVLAVVVLAWGATSFASTWVASRVGTRLAGTLVALLLAWALIFNLTQLPYATWFKVAMFIAFQMSAFCIGRVWARGPTFSRCSSSAGSRSAR